MVELDYKCDFFMCNLSISSYYYIPIHCVYVWVNDCLLGFQRRTKRDWCQPINRNFPCGGSSGNRMNNNTGFSNRLLRFQVRIIYKQKRKGICDFYFRKYLQEKVDERANQIPDIFNSKAIIQFINEIVR